MNKIHILLIMIFLHIIDDYRLQGILASMKQKEWWMKQEGYKDMYKHDYVIALLCHSFSWAFMIMLPIFVSISFKLTPAVISIFISNLLAHALIDDMKANKHQINLIVDQLVHLLQIVITWLILWRIL